MEKTIDEEFNEILNLVIRADDKTKERVFKKLKEERKKRLTFSFKEIVCFLKLTTIG